MLFQISWPLLTSICMSMALNVYTNCVFRSLSALVQHAAIFIIHIVWQNCSIRRIKLLQKSLRKRLLLGGLLHAQSISAMFVNEERIRRITNCSLLYVGVVLSHTTGNACQGTTYCCIFFFCQYPVMRACLFGSTV